MRNYNRQSGKVFTFAAIIALLTSAAALPSLASDGSHMRLLQEFRPIGSSGNNLENPGFDPVPGSAELASTPLNFAP